MGDRNLNQKLSSKDHPERSRPTSLGILAARSQENKYLWPHSPAGLPRHTLAEAKGKGGPLAVLHGKSASRGREKSGEG